MERSSLRVTGMEEIGCPTPDHGAHGAHYDYLLLT